MTTNTRREKASCWNPPVERVRPGGAEHPPVCIIVPVRNERDGVVATLEALRTQIGIDPARVEILVLANNCEDDTADQIRSFALRHPAFNLHLFEQHFPAESANIGNARRWLMDLAADRLPGNGIIASTDGDTVADPHWLAATLREFERGVGFVGGRILTFVPQNSQLDVRRIYLQDTVYRLLVAEAESLLDPDPWDRWPRHFQHFGASLAVTRAAYLSIGGLPEVPVLEDMAMYSELRRHDVAVRHSPRVQVTTSARMSGRAGMGLSTQLSEWQSLIDERREPLVESAAFTIARIHEQSRLRNEWREDRSLRTSITCGQYIEVGLASFAPAVERLETLTLALRQLRTALVDLRRLPAIQVRSSRSSRYVSA